MMYINNLAGVGRFLKFHKLVRCDPAVQFIQWFKLNIHRSFKILIAKAWINGGQHLSKTIKPKKLQIQHFKLIQPFVDEMRNYCYAYANGLEWVQRHDNTARLYNDYQTILVSDQHVFIIYKLRFRCAIIHSLTIMTQKLFQYLYAYAI